MSQRWAFDSDGGRVSADRSAALIGSQAVRSPLWTFRRGSQRRICAPVGRPVTRRPAYFSPWMF